MAINLGGVAHAEVGVEPVAMLISSLYVELPVPPALIWKESPTLSVAQLDKLNVSVFLGFCSTQITYQLSLKEMYVPSVHSSIDT